MAFSEPKPGYVVRYDYLWTHEVAAGRDQGKDRPACRVAASDSQTRPRFVVLLPNTHTPGSQYVVVRNDGLRDSRDSYVCTGDLVYTHENLDGGLPSDPIYTPVGLAMGSQTNLVLTTDKILKAANDEAKRVLAPHERNMPNIYPSRKSRDGLFVVEVALAPGDSSFVRA